MKEKNSSPTRIDMELVEEIKKFSTENDLSMRRASKEIAKIVKSVNLRNKQMRF